VRKLAVKLRFAPDRIISVGQLAEADGRLYFEYDRDFLDGRLALSPFKLPPRPGLIEHLDRRFGQLPGVFDDSLPDGWGLLLMDRAFRAKGIDPASVSPLQRLAYVGTRAMGALTYFPAADLEDADTPTPRSLDLHKLGENAQEVYAGNAVDVLPELIREGGSAGGARPKVLVGVRDDHVVAGAGDLPDGYEHWIVKFCAKADLPDAGPMEFAYAAMAKAAGIQMPPTRLFAVAPGTSYFAVRRFDRGPGNVRAHVHTFGNMIHARFRIPSTDYADLLKVTSALTRNYQDVLRALRQAAFNVAACNRDDHAKNFAFVMNEQGEWSLSPAYDVGFSPGPAGEHAMSILGEGRAPTREHLSKLATEFDVRRPELQAIVESVNAAVSDWPRFADEAGCTAETARAIGLKIKPL
jgi:serine/threonine-protein kinase HipA